MAEYLSEELVMIGLKPTDKQNVCELMVDQLVAKGKLDEKRKQALVDKLLEREALSSTGIGDGVAIPHASGESIEDMLVAVAQIPDGIDFDSLDGEPVHLVFMIIGSDRSPRTHLQLLAMIVRVCKNKELVKKLIDSKSQQEAFELIASAAG